MRNMKLLVCIFCVIICGISYSQDTTKNESVVYRVVETAYVGEKALTLRECNYDNEKNPKKYEVAWGVVIQFIGDMMIFTEAGLIGSEDIDYLGKVVYISAIDMNGELKKRIELFGGRGIELVRDRTFQIYITGSHGILEYTLTNNRVLEKELREAGIDQNGDVIIRRFFYFNILK